MSVTYWSIHKVKGNRNRSQDKDITQSFDKHNNVLDK